ncbi:ABC transporter permease [Modestobacter versicolor]|uniref:ABC transporter permease n=1 Tax=Modestobacter versicolor TaxID=429133 RepID=A0A323V619_9ACTN|nr:ABC transporter permease [Modestobacter versicolor]MBB3674858.1 peptide/nickel transport system permease protein [Modestobacter versicolor]PZA20192.1 ABC transporter permease [Modestobacter versicolor]
MADRRLVLGLAVLAVLAAYAVLVPAVAGVDDRVTDFAAARQAPSADHPFGTDSAGRDLFVRTAAGLRVSLLIAAVCAVLSTVIGALVGALSGVAGGWADRLAMRVVDGVNAVPHLLLGIVLVALFRGSLVAVVASIALTHWTQVARVVRAEVLSLRDRPHVDAAVLGGATRWRVVHRHLLPAALPQALVAAVLLLPHAVWHESTLSFLGLGLPPHRASLGTLLEEARSSLLLGGWWTLAFPALGLVLATLAVAAVGSALRDRVALPQRVEVPR